MSSEYHTDIEMMNQGSAMDLLSIDLVNSNTKMSEVFLVPYYSLMNYWLLTYPKRREVIIVRCVLSN